MPSPTGDDALTSLETLTPAEVAALFRVDGNTVARWAENGHISSFRTPGGHRRYLKSEVLALRTQQRSLAH
ncbi:BldC family transcriptional regulator [Nocardiopsis metallicus]|uniref:Excisionase family DNA binding protein n=1 Tax=Nocardiopsis metallicus TaxID=179819 RepID=A0A840W852_9ACTN|nr:BldC family transcriptional regulator [Nocardiopsis metallicus]MBB5492224.1 excisionase family DNA binding protein [Nocardiopsis metallicus]